VCCPRQCLCGLQLWARNDLFLPDSQCKFVFWPVALRGLIDPNSGEDWTVLTYRPVLHGLRREAPTQSESGARRAEHLLGKVRHLFLKDMCLPPLPPPDRLPVRKTKYLRACQTRKHRRTFSHFSGNGFTVARLNSSMELTR
jgi:hypothetical protein